MSEADMQKRAAEEATATTEAPVRDVALVSEALQKAEARVYPYGKLDYALQDGEKSPGHDRQGNPLPPANFQIVDLLEYPIKTITVKAGTPQEKVIEYRDYDGNHLDPSAVALLVDYSTRNLEARSATSEGYVFKGIRAGETVTPEKIKERFGRDVSFSVGIGTAEGEMALAVSNIDGERPVRVVGFGVDDEVDETTQPRLPQQEALTEVAPTAEAKPATDEPFIDAATAARVITGLEAMMDGQVGDSTETGAVELEARGEVAQKAAEDLGEEAVDEVGVAVRTEEKGLPTAEEGPRAQPEEAHASETANKQSNNAEQSPEEKEYIKNGITRQVGDFIHEASRLLDSAPMQLEQERTGLQDQQRAFMNGANNAISDFDRLLQRAPGSYPVESIRAALSPITEALHKARATASVREDNASNIHRAIGRSLEVFKTITAEAELVDRRGSTTLAERGYSNEQDAVPSALTIVKEANTIVDAEQATGILDLLKTYENAGANFAKALSAQLGRLDDVVRMSYSNGFNMDELQDIFGRIRLSYTALQNTDPVSAIDAGLSRLVSRIRNAQEVLVPPQ